jgi:hypothetical protein
VDLGKQYDKDNFFKKQARLHQSKYRAEVLKVDCDLYGNMLQEEDGRKGLNFYQDFNILEEVYKRYGGRYSKQLYSNLLRSEHIPFNLFIPLKHNLEFAKKVLNDLLSNSIKEILKIDIEYAPPFRELYLNDYTSFDAYIEYKHTDGSLGILGIEVKYTEKGYSLKDKSDEKKKVENKASRYWSITKASGLFKKGVEDKLILNDYRQIWRNHILGESIRLVDQIKHFTSITFYPEGNTHFSKAIAEYQKLLKSSDNVLGITYEDYLSVLKKHSPNQRFNSWMKYLEERYIMVD